MAATDETPALSPAPPRRGRPPKVSRGQIVAAAISLGLDSFSMQGIAEQLGVSTPTLYSHVAGRGEVIALVNTALRERMQSFASDATEWRAWLADFAREVRQFFTPSARAFVGNGRAEGPALTMPVGMAERGLVLLLEGGFTPAAAGHAVWLAFRTAITAGSEESSSVGIQVAATTDLLSPSARAAFPATAEVHAALLAHDHDAFEQDLRIVLDGLAAQLDR